MLKVLAFSYISTKNLRGIQEGSPKVHRKQNLT